MHDDVPVLNLDRETARQIRSFLVEKNIQMPIRIDLCFKGCCDAALELRVDDVRKRDIRIDLKGLVFVISPETYELTGGVMISHVEEKGGSGFRVVSRKPVSEWSGFGVCQINVPNKEKSTGTQF